MSGTITKLDRIVNAMSKLNSRIGSRMTPRQRVANAQHWERMADIGVNHINRFTDPSDPDVVDDFLGEQDIFIDLGLPAPAEPALNPFLNQRNYERYRLQYDFLDWCRNNRLEPNQNTLDIYRSMNR